MRYKRMHQTLAGILSLSLILLLKATHFDYYLNRGRKMFVGFERAVHFLDKFTFLSEKMFGITGAMTSYYKFHTNNEFSLTFDMHMYGKMKSAEDGFLILLGSSALTKEQLKVDDAYANLKGFEQKLNAVG